MLYFVFYLFTMFRYIFQDYYIRYLESYWNHIDENIFIDEIISILIKYDENIRIYTYYKTDNFIINSLKLYTSNIDFRIELYKKGMKPRFIEYFTSFDIKMNE